MIKHFTNYFTIWWHSVVTLLVCFLLFFIGLYGVQNNRFLDVIVCLILLSELLTAISAIVQFFKSKWITGLGQLVIVVVIFIIVAFTMMFGATDFYANWLELPENIKLELPVELDGDVKKEIALQNSVPYNLKFVLANGGQPGMYNYYVWLKPKENGTIYLKAFEITQNDPLSVKRLAKRSSVKVKPGYLTVYSHEFTIYEGDWGHPYAARIEVWFKPDNDDKDYKLLQKNYKIEGWMR